jgi:hypothetical protein
MKWRHLEESISKMPQEHLDQSIRFGEPYDEGREGYSLDLIVAVEDIYVGSEPAQFVFGKAGEPYLD